MPSFKDFLSEGVSDKEIRATVAIWRKEFSTRKWLPAFGKFKIIQGLISHESPALLIQDFMVENRKLALPFVSSYRCQCQVSTNILNSFENFPIRIYWQQPRNQFDWASLSFSYAQDHLISLEHFPKSIHGGIDTTLLHNLNLSKCNKFIEETGNKWSISSKYVGPILSTLLIESLREINIRDSKVGDILNKHFKSDRDIMDCQEELIQAGLKEFAKL